MNEDSRHKVRIEATSQTVGSKSRVSKIGKSSSLKYVERMRSWTMTMEAHLDDLELGPAQL